MTHICQFCNKGLKGSNALTQHTIRCPQNPNRIAPVGKWTEEQKRAFSQKRIATGCGKRTLTEEQSLAWSIRSKKTNSNYWTDERKKEHSVRMKQIVADNPDSYSKNNVSGRVQLYPVQSSLGETKVKGRWELAVANWLNDKDIRWTNEIQPYSYFWNDKWHLYFPDFLLLDHDILIEVKGFETDRDKAKWQAVSDKKFIVIRKDDLKDLSRAIVVL